MKKIIIIILISIPSMFCVKKQADGKDYCEKGCKTACEAAGGNVSSCIDTCVSDCENVGPNPFYKKD